MTISRRTLLAGTAAVAAVAALPGCRRGGRTVVDVSKFGARGDGVADDSLAIQAAVAALRPKATLYFPPGTYRFAQRHPSGAAAIVIAGLSNVDVEFGFGAELFMDNLDPSTHTGTSHGLLIRGPASRIALRNVSIRWPTGGTRSFGDGIRVAGCPSASADLPTGWVGPAAPVDGIALSGCVIQASPQAGVIMQGVSDVAVVDLRVTDSLADGLHFNACRRASVNGYRAVNTGDDGLALVTYFAHQFSFDSTSHTFAFPSLTDWSNADFAIDNINVDGGSANGVRIAGANRVSVGGLRVAGVRSGSAVMIDSAEPGADVGWNYVASRAVHLQNVAASQCETGIHLLARPGAASDQRFTDFDLNVSEATLDDCSNWSVRAESLTDHRVSGLRIADCNASSTSTTGGNGGVGITNASRISLGNVVIRHAEPVVAFRAANAKLAVDRLGVTISAAEPASTAPPCVSIDGSYGGIGDIEIGWPAAPPSWSAVRLGTTGQCGGQAPFVIENLKVVPPGVGSALMCS